MDSWRRSSRRGRRISAHDDGQRSPEEAAPGSSKGRRRRCSAPPDPRGPRGHRRKHLHTKYLLSLCRTSMYGHSAVPMTLDQLLEGPGKADVNGWDQECGRAKDGSIHVYSFTPLHYAAHNGSATLVKALVEHGAKVDARTDCGLTPLMVAARSYHGYSGSVMSDLVDFGADVRLCDMCLKGYTPLHSLLSSCLHYGIYSGHIPSSTISALCAAGADIRATSFSSSHHVIIGTGAVAEDNDGKSPLDIASGCELPHALIACVIDAPEHVNFDELRCPLNVRSRAISIFSFAVTATDELYRKFRVESWVGAIRAMLAHGAGYDVMASVHLRTAAWQCAW